MHLRGTAWYAFGIHRFLARDRGKPDKINAIKSMGPIQNLKRVQQITGCLAALSHFISRLGERGLPLYQLLRKSDRFVWTSEAQQALDGLKSLLTTAPVLVPPAEGSPSST